MACKLGLPETGLAIIPGAGGTQRLPRVVGLPKAKEMVFTAKILNADEALSIGDSSNTIVKYVMISFAYFICDIARIRISGARRRTRGCNGKVPRYCAADQY